MAYAGYRIKINNVIFPNHDMAKGSYSFEKSPRVSKSWDDLTGIGKVPEPVPGWNMAKDES